DTGVTVSAPELALEGRATADRVAPMVGAYSDAGAVGDVGFQFDAIGDAGGALVRGLHRVHGVRDRRVPPSSLNHQFRGRLVSFSRTAKSRCGLGLLRSNR